MKVIAVGKPMAYEELADIPSKDLPSVSVDLSGREVRWSWGKHYTNRKYDKIKVDKKYRSILIKEE